MYKVIINNRTYLLTAAELLKAQRRGVSVTHII